MRRFGTRLAPRSLPGQIAVLVACALFAAQAINFALLLRERRELRFEQATGPAATRLVDAAERTARGRPLLAERGRVHLTDASPVAPTGHDEQGVEAVIARAFADAGLPAGRVLTVIRDAPPRSERRGRRSGPDLVIAVEQPGGRWLSTRVPWRGTDRVLVWRLIAQTLVLYAVVLLPVLWIGRRIAAPLRDLAAAAERFRPGARPADPVAERGPDDVRILIAAFTGLQRRVAAMLGEKDRMLGAIGHDLRTPLAALRVRVESVEDESDRVRMVETIRDMDRMLDDILSLARLGHPSEPLTEVDLPALVDAVVEDFRDLGAAVTFVEADRLRLRLRPSLIRRAVRNLIENAVKYGGGATVRIEPAAASVAIVVADDGPGIPPDRLADVFDPFTRLEESRNRDTGGSGLGLALAQAIAHEAGGDIALANRPGGGLDATITLPLRT